MPAPADDAPAGLRLDKRGDPIHRGYDVKMKYRRADARRDPYPGLRYDRIILIEFASLIMYSYAKYGRL